MTIPTREHRCCLLEFAGKEISASRRALDLLSRALLLSLSCLLVTGSAGGVQARPLQDNLAGEVRVVSSSVQGLRLSISLPTMGVSSFAPMAQTGPYSPPILPGGGQLAVGKPDLPVFAEWVLIPNGTSPSIRVDPGEPLVFEDIDIPPVQPPKPDSPGAVRPRFVKDAGVYSTDADYPGVFAQAEPVKNIRGQACTIVRLYPYQHNPVTRRLRIYQNLKVDLDFKGEIRPVPAHLKSAEFERMLRRQALNADAVLSAQQAIKAQAVMKRLYRSDAQAPPESLDSGQVRGGDYLIVCDPAFQAAAETLAVWKRLSGFRTEVVTTDQTGATAAEIEAYIDNAQHNWLPAPAYVLLLGDAEYIPCFYELPHASDRDRQEGLMQGKIASDRYYGDTNEDGIADLFVGRLPVDTAQEARIAVDRIIRYERTPPDPVMHRDFYMNFAAAAYFYDAEPSDGYADARYVATSEDIYQYLYDAGYSGRRIYSHDAGVRPAYWSEYYVFENDQGGGRPLPDYLLDPEFAWDASTADIADALHDGVFLLTYRGHGARLTSSVPQGWWYPGGWMQPEFQEHDVAALANGALTPVVLSTTCMTGWFDNETDDEGYQMYSGGRAVQTHQTDPDNESFCEQFILNPNGGAVGVIGATRTSYSGRNDRLAWGWMDAIWPDFIEYHSGTYGNSTSLYQMGPVFEYGKRYMLTKYSYDLDYTQTTIDELVLFGDPTLEIRTGVPEVLTAADVAHPSWVNSGYPADVTITVTKGGTSLADARVTISRASAPQDYWTGLTDASGGVTFAGLTTSQRGDYHLVVTAHNCVPYEATIASESVVGGAVTVERQVSASRDDGYAASGAAQDLDTDCLRIGSSAGIQPPYYVAGMVFRNINIPRGADIIGAYLKICSSDYDLDDLAYGAIWAEAADDAPAFSDSRRIGLTSRTYASVNWDHHGPWWKDTWYESPDIAGVIQEVVNRDGWSPNNAVAILYGTRQELGGFRCFSSCERGGEYAPKLEITYAVEDTCVITGRVTFMADGLAGVHMDGFPGQVFTDADGYYRAEVGFGWSGSVAAVKTGYDFAPAYKDYYGVTFNQTHDYQAAVRMYTLSGRVLGSDGTGISGATVSANSDGGSSITGEAGAYRLAVPHGWSGRVTASKAGYAFAPPYLDYGNITSDQSGRDYVAPTQIISGYVRTLDGTVLSQVQVAVDNHVTAGATDSTGYYRLALPDGWSGRVILSKMGYVFSPLYRDYTRIGSDHTGQDYAATTQTRTISGFVRSFDGLPIPAATVSADNDAGSTITDSAGHYSLTVPHGWSGRTMPSKMGYLFSPACRDYTDVTSDLADEDYASMQTWSISGYVRTWEGAGIPDVMLSADNGGGLGISDSAGYYRLPVPRGWSGRVTPAKTGYIFSPAYREYPAVVRNRTVRNYSGQTIGTP